MALSCPLGITRSVWQQNNVFFSIEWILYWPSLFLSRWLDIGLILVCMFKNLETLWVHKHAKKLTWPISSHIDLQLLLVNNLYSVYYENLVSRKTSPLRCRDRGVFWKIKLHRPSILGIDYVTRFFTVARRTYRATPQIPRSSCHSVTWHDDCRTETSSAEARSRIDSNTVTVIV